MMIGNHVLVYKFHLHILQIKVNGPSEIDFGLWFEIGNSDYYFFVNIQHHLLKKLPFSSCIQWQPCHDCCYICESFSCFILSFHLLYLSLNDYYTVSFIVVL